MIRCVIIDDEPAAREILTSYVNKVSSLELTETFSSSLTAREYLKQNSADLLLLDIEMPHLTGIELLKSLSNPPEVIFTTAYSDYALEGYELSVIDYLLKPISMERFLKAIDKAEQKLEKNRGQDNWLKVKADGRIYQLSYDDILFAESMGDYVTIYTHEKKITYYQTMKSLMEMLSAPLFSRVHKSYLVRLSAIEYLEGNQIKIGDHTIPIGKTYKEDFLNSYMR
ncbi:LytTR family DNA-binding domain-containing protein [Rhodohalobacter sp.]|uniref:LytR/AlgR family response regulator transcription factor n=1 Tax=Rhodohalobacter sp. TaxID=1974210 RepID=UPI002ACDE7EE|nr:LytTR family DNA-binding domain-containing protein [Rhodohalobacter sp.]MDZ7754805.1 LytTR family DNA-binding domain-containing protein [Rhodohalobacter sp.]